VLGVPAPAPSPGPSVSNYFRMKPLVYSVASEAWSISLLDCWWKAFSMVVGSGMISPIFPDAQGIFSVQSGLLFFFLLCCPRTHSNPWGEVGLGIWWS
jgi:hypothetical protein